MSRILTNVSSLHLLQVDGCVDTVKAYIHPPGFGESFFFSYLVPSFKLSLASAQSRLDSIKANPAHPSWQIQRTQRSRPIESLTSSFFADIALLFFCAPSPETAEELIVSADLVAKRPPEARDDDARVPASADPGAKRAMIVERGLFGDTTEGSDAEVFHGTPLAS